MTLVLLALVAGVVAGYARGGGLTRLTTLRPTRNRLLVTALGLHAVGVLSGWLWEPLLPVLVGLSWGLLGFYAWVNRSIHGAALIAAGLLANATVMLLNGAMPVAENAATRAGADHAVILSTGDHVLINSETRLAWLGKVVPVAFPPRPEVVSPGDVALAAGVAVLIGMGLTGRREPNLSLDTADDPDWPADPTGAAHLDEPMDRTDATAADHERIQAPAGQQRSAAV